MRLFAPLLPVLLVLLLSLIRPASAQAVCTVDLLAAGTWSGEVTLQDGTLSFARFSGKSERQAAVLTPQARDWSACAQLVLTIAGTNPDSVYLGLRLLDGQGQEAFWYEILAAGASQEVVVPLSELKLDLHDIRRVELFVRRPALFERDPHPPVSLTLRSMRLEARKLSISLPLLQINPALPRRVKLQARSSLTADWQVEVRQGERLILTDRFLRHDAPRWLLPLPGPGHYRIGLSARRGESTTRRYLNLEVPATPPGPDLIAWTQPGSLRPDAYLLAPPPQPAVRELHFAGDETEGLILPLIAQRALDLKIALDAPGFRSRIYRVGWLPAWRPQQLYRIGEPGLIADALLPVDGGFSPVPGRLEALYLELEPIAGDRYRRVPVSLSLDWGSGSKRFAWTAETFPLPAWKQRLARTASSIYPEYLDRAYGPASARRWAETGVLLREHHLQIDNLYQPPRSPQQIDTLFALGGERAWINLGYLGPGLLDERLPGLRQAYEHVRALGRLEHAYVFAFDEFTGAPDEFRAQLEILNRELPGLKVISTARLWDTEHEWPANLHWSPSLRDFDLYPELSGNAADWGYVFVALRPPYPNWLLESDLGEARLIPWLAWQLDLDGLLYYTLNRWPAAQGLIAAADFPLLPWQPNCFEDSNGDGCLIYPGDSGVLPSLRLKNLQQGLEDQALLRLLAEQDPAAAAALASRVARSPRDFSPDPAALAAAATELRRTLARTMAKKAKRQGRNQALIKDQVKGQMTGPNHAVR